MKLTGLMIARSEAWIIKSSLIAALRWVDELIVVDHASTDATYKIICEVQGQYHHRVRYSRWATMKEVQRPAPVGGTMMVEDPENEVWDEMSMRQHSLDIGRKHRGTHFAIIDADEILTANHYSVARSWFLQLKPRQCIDVPMLAMRTMDNYQNDESVWSHSFVTLGFMDDPELAWKPRADGYQHHARSPMGSNPEHARPFVDKDLGGVMHFQFANRRRLVAKHALYAMVDHLRWPTRESVDELNAKYGRALEPDRGLGRVPRAYIPPEVGLVNLEGRPWQEDEIRRLITKHGRDSFAGLDLRGLA